MVQFSMVGSRLAQREIGTASAEVPGVEHWIRASPQLSSGLDASNPKMSLNWVSVSGMCWQYWVELIVGLPE